MLLTCGYDAETAPNLFFSFTCRIVIKIRLQYNFVKNSSAHGKSTHAEITLNHTFTEEMNTAGKVKAINVVQR